MGPGKDVPEDYFFVNGEEVVYDDPDCDMVIEALDEGAFWCGIRTCSTCQFIARRVLSKFDMWLTLYTFIASASSVLLRQKILRKCREDIYHFFNNEKGQIAIYDAVNPLAAGRRSLAKEFAKHDVQVSFGALGNLY